jgi:ribosomal protein S18 acetylase RimI-like enzyme
VSAPPPDPDDLEVRAARPDDLSFLVASNRAMALETERRELPEATVTAGVRAALGDAGRGRYWIADRAGEAVGCLLVTTEWSDWREGWFWWIQSVYVVPAARGRGVYARLHARVREEARAAGDVVGLRLYVEQDNHRAQATYRRLGMAPTRYRMFEEGLAPA